jgi:hypothetical protein
VIHPDQRFPRSRAWSAVKAIAAVLLEHGEASPATIARVCREHRVPRIRRVPHAFYNGVIVMPQPTTNPTGKDQFK